MSDDMSPPLWQWETAVYFCGFPSINNLRGNLIRDNESDSCQPEPITQKQGQPLKYRKDPTFSPPQKIVKASEYTSQVQRATHFNIFGMSLWDARWDWKRSSTSAGEWNAKENASRHRLRELWTSRTYYITSRAPLSIILLVFVSVTNATRSSAK